ncbi:MAG: hypothetical protein VB092_00025 [Oscillospiraceae bacterium]|nr:hypothetical protein [Oscillospiraceae bacterium]
MTPDTIDTLKKEIDQGYWDYVASTDKTAIEKAKASIKKEGFDGARSSWETARSKADYSPDMKRGERIRLLHEGIGKEDIALAVQLAKEAADAGDYKTYFELTAEVAAEAHNAGQIVQAFSLLQKASPEGRLYAVKVTAEKIANDFKLRYGKPISIEINKDLAKEYEKASAYNSRCY